MPDKPTFSCYAKCGGADNEYMLQCDPGKHWIHYSCTTIPNLDVAGTNIIEQLDYTCHLCVSKHLVDEIEMLKSQLKVKEGELEMFRKKLDLLNDVKKVNNVQDVHSSASVDDGNESDICDGSSSTNAKLNASKSRNSDTVLKVKGDPPPLQKSATSTENNRKICRFFKSGSCRYGRKGSGCNFKHPNTCRSFLSGTCDGKCNLLHPKLCFSSVKRRECYKSDCKFYHLPHTRRHYVHKNEETQGISHHQNKFHGLSEANSFLEQRMLRIEEKMDRLLNQNSDTMDQNMHSKLNPRANVFQVQSRPGFWQYPPPAQINQA